MERVVVTAEEIAESRRPEQEKPRPESVPPRSDPPVQPSLWVRIGLAPLALALPLLCLLTIALRLVTRSLPERNRLAWASYLSTLLAVSGLVTTVAVVVIAFSGHSPVSVSEGLAELDSRTDFPALPSAADLNSEETSEKLNPLVTVISPVARRIFWQTSAPGDAIGAGVILSAGPDGYLIATARHVVDAMGEAKSGERAMVASVSGVWSNAQVVARHQTLDLALVWLARHEGKAVFELPVAPANEVKVGEPIALIGHPQGLRFTLSTGIVSRKDQDMVQLSAPVSPGDSGGPVFDARGRLVAIVTSMVDKSRAPNAENLNFAVRADALAGGSGWTFTGQGQHYLTAFRSAQPAAR